MLSSNNKKIFIYILILLTALLIDYFYAKTSFLFALSIFLGLQIFHFNNPAKIFFINPLVIFSIMYFGYSVGGIYYSFSDGDFGKFVNFINLEKNNAEKYLIYALLYVNVCYLFTAVGYQLFAKEVQNYTLKSEIAKTNRSYTKPSNLVVSLLVIGGFYWIWVSHIIAGGVIDALILFQVFPHLVEEHKISTAPYLLYFAGINIWLMRLIESRSRIGIWFYIFSILGFVISVSTARISITLTYAFTQMYLVYMLAPHSRKLIHRSFVLMIFLGFVLFFLREISNHLFISDGVGLDGFEFNILASIIGGGNVADLQQLVIIFYMYGQGDILFGASYFDWLNNAISGFFNLKAQSVGLRIADLYVPATSGAPTPGAIGEAFANFHLLAPFVMFLFGVFLAKLNTFVVSRKSLICYYLYASFLTSFVFLYPKVDSTMVANFFWNSFPALIVLLISSTMARIVKYSSARNYYSNI